MDKKFLLINDVTDRPALVLMWGYSKENFQETFDLLVRANLDPCALVEPSVDLKECNYPMPIIQSKDLSVSDYANLPVIIAPGMGYERLEECISKIRCAEDSNSFSGANKRARVFHPCAALRGYQYDLTGRVLCVGFPGSGNVLVQTIISRLFPKIKRPIYSLPVSGTLVPDHQQMWKTLIQTRLNVSSEEIVFIQQDIEHISLITTCKDGRFLDLYDINCPHWHTAYFMPLNVLPSVNQIVEWKRRGGAVVIILRNPLDVIVSCAAKLIRPPNRLLQDTTWFRRVVKILVNYIDGILSMPGEKLTIHYEDILLRPCTQIFRIAQFLGATITVDEISSLWDEIGLKELAPPENFNRDRTQNHYYKPGIGKWMQYFDGRHAQIIEEEGLQQSMLSIGYEFEKHLFRTNYENEPPLVANEIKQAQTGDFFHFLFGANPYFNCSSLYQNRLMKSSINYITNDEGFARAIDALDSEYLADYQAAAQFVK